MVLNQGFPDVRVCQEATALQQKGYEVWIIVSSLETRSPEYAAKDFNTIILDFSGHNKNSFLNKVRALTYSYPALLDKLFSTPAFVEIRERVCVVHAHDLHWCRFGHDIARRLGAKFVADFHENSPALPEYFGRKIWSKSLKQTLVNMTRSKIFLSMYERWVINRADAVITVVHENKQRLIKSYGTGAYYCVSNTKDPVRLPYMGLSTAGKVTLLYHGSIQEKRGIRVLAEAFASVDTTNLRLVILGFSKNSPEKNAVLDLLSNVPVDRYSLMDWTSDLDKILDVIKQADIGVIPHERCELTETTIPNKLFEYFCYGKPVIVSDVAPLKRVVEETHTGLVFKAGDIKDLARCCETVVDKALLHEFSANARKAAEGAYGWDKDRRELLRVYDKFA